ncbi:MAG: ABC transporter permease [Vicinamibacterales bacterium]
MDQLRQDFRFALRSFRRAPAFSIVIVLTLGLGIGANTAIFSLMDQVLLRMLPVRAPQELVLLNGPGPFSGRTMNSMTFSVPMFRGLEQGSRGVMAGMFARFDTSATLSTAKQSERVYAELVTGDYFSVLGVGSVLGRTLGHDDDRTPSGHPVVVLSYGYWQRRFGGEPGVLNLEIRINNHPMTVVGVAARGFSGVDTGSPADLFVPIMMKAELTPTWNDLESWRSRFVTIMGRLKPGVTIDQAAAAMNVVYRQQLHEDMKTLSASAPENFRKRFLEKTLLVLPGHKGRSDLRTAFSTPLVVLMAMVGLVLLIACANVANLLLARAAAQQKEVAIRLALGAGRWRVVRTRLTESVVLSLGGAVVGLLFAWWTTTLLIETLPFARAVETLSADPDARVVLFAIAISTLTALVFGLGPAFQSARPSLTSTLKEDAGTVAGGGRQARFRKGLVVAQVALSVLLLAGAGLFARSLYNLRSLNPGFVATDLLQFSVDPALSGYTRERSLALFRQAQDQLGSLPGAASAASAFIPVMTDSTWQSTVQVQGYTRKEDENMNPAFNAVSPGYFATMGMPLVMGREFRPTDADGAPRVAIINETMAKYFWGSDNPIGRRFGFGRDENDNSTEVVGVVRDSKFATMRDEVPRFVYVPYLQQEALDQMTFYVRARSDVAGVPGAARQVIQRLDPNLPIFDMKTMEAQVDESLFLERLVASLSMLFGGLATLLAAVGLYGVMSYTVSRRTREIGIRMALGAERTSVLWMVLREVAVMAGAGIALGLPAAIGLSRFVESQLYGLSPTDAPTLVVAAAVLATVAMFAGYVPARRATRVDPMVALRYE